MQSVSRKILQNSINQRFYQITTAVFNNSVKPVNLAYASYESTGSASKSPLSSSTSKTGSLPTSPLIIIHGLLGSKSNWNSMCKVYHQRTSRKVYAIDARNHGDSPHTTLHSYEAMVGDLKLFLDELGMGKCALIGHSMGGRAAMKFALEHPERVERLIVVDISPVYSSPDLISLAGILTSLKDVNMPKNMRMSMARTYVNEQLAVTIPEKDLRNFLLTNLVQKEDGSFKWRANIDILLSQYKNITEFKMTPGKIFNGPVYFIGGGSSDYIQKSDHDEIKSLFPKAKFSYIEGAGHWVHSDKPTEFLDLTINFLKEN